MRASVLALLLLSGPVEAGQSLSPAEVAAIRGKVEARTEEAEAFAATVRRQAEAMRGEAEALQRSARSNRLKPVQSGAGQGQGIDLDRLVAEADQLQRAGNEVGPQLLAFVSFSMPEPSLRQILRDVAAVGGAVVFRGMPQDSAKAFSARILRVLGNEKAPTSIGIDPRLFRAFDVRAVPTFVVVSTGFELCDGFDCKDTPPPHDRMMGNVSVAHVLETVAAGGGPGAAVGQVLLKRLARPGQGSGDGR